MVLLIMLMKRTDEDCWMDSNLACARNDMDFEVDRKWSVFHHLLHGHLHHQ